MYEALNLPRNDHFLSVYNLLYKKCFSFAGAKFTAEPKMFWQWTRMSRSSNKFACLGLECNIPWVINVNVGLHH